MIQHGSKPGKGRLLTMKKFGKIILGIAAIGAAVAGVAYFLKNILMKDYLDDYDDDDFDNDLYDEDDDDRDYVTITPDSSKADMDSDEEELVEADDEETEE